MRLNDVTKGLNVHKRGNSPRTESWGTSTLRSWHDEEEPAKETEKELLENMRKTRRVEDNRSLEAK